MSIYFKVNNKDYPLTAASVKSGTGAGGAWELVTAKGSGKDRKRINLWIANHPSGIQEGDSFIVKDVVAFKYSSKKNARDEWKEEIALTVNVSPVSGVSAPKREQEFYDIPASEGDEGLPF